MEVEVKSLVFTFQGNVVLKLGSEEDSAVDHRSDLVQPRFDVRNYIRPVPVAYHTTEVRSTRYF